MYPFIKNICLPNEPFYTSGIVLKTMTNDEQWNECLLGDGKGRRDRWKAVRNSAESRRERVSSEEKKQVKAAYANRAHWQVSVMATMAH